MKNKKIISYKYVGYDPMNKCGIYRVNTYEEERNWMLWQTTMATSTAIRKLRETIEYLEELGKKPSTISRCIASIRSFYQYVLRKGKVKKATKIKVKIPAGIDDNQTVILRGEGAAGSKGGEKGDLFITVHIKKHRLYTRKQNNV